MINTKDIERLILNSAMWNINIKCVTREAMERLSTFLKDNYNIVDISTNENKGMICDIEYIEKVEVKYNK